jgi:hypothetical protein
MSKISDLNDNDKAAVLDASSHAGISANGNGKFIVDWTVDEVVQWLVRTGKKYSYLTLYLTSYSIFTLFTLYNISFV